ncbi:MAG TPA: hypothetical protein VKJ45_22255, partial [Blastocatellia bacterium]|nr:hypothetical protein [Blastocatellia bacterium]
RPGLVRRLPLPKAASSTTAPGVAALQRDAYSGFRRGVAGFDSPVISFVHHLKQLTVRPLSGHTYNKVV